MENIKHAEPVVEREFETSAHLLSEFMRSEQSSTFCYPHSLLFRGEPSDKFSLIPSALRPERQEEFNQMAYEAGCLINVKSSFNEGDHVQCELRLAKYFYNASNEQGLSLPPLPYKWHERMLNDWFFEGTDKEWIPKELAEMVALMQHYGLPTRMLDWSSNILTALYFAASGAAQRLTDNAINENDYMVVWILRKPDEYDFKSYMHDAFPIRFVTPSYAGNPNLNAQKGVLTYVPSYAFSKSMDYALPLDQYLKKFYAEPNHTCDEPVLTKARIPITDCHDTLKILFNFGINGASLFPGYGSIRRQLNEKRYFINLL